MIGGKRHTRETRSLAAIAVAAIVIVGLLASWLPGAMAQDGTDFAGTAVAEFTPTTVVEPTPTPTPPAVTYDAPEFMDGPFRITVQRAAFAHAIDELDLKARSDRDWVAVVVDVVNFSDVATSITPSQFSIRSGGVPALLSWADSAIEKQPACAAPMSSSGLVPGPSSKRDLKP